jgi:hypothetical protein
MDFGGQNVININSLSFDLTDCDLLEDGPSQKFWLSKEGVCYGLQYHAATPAWEFDLTNADVPRAFFKQQCADNGGAMLSMDTTSLDGMEVLRGLFKYRSIEANSMGMMFVGIIWIPFSNYMYQLNIEALERGTTGFREAAIALIHPEMRSRDQEEQEPIQVESAEEMFALMRKTPVRALLSDEERFDEKFPNHPLSLVRKRMKVVSDSLRMDKTWWQSLKPFRISRH